MGEFQFRHASFEAISKRGTINKTFAFPFLPMS